MIKTLFTILTTGRWVRNVFGTKTAPTWQEIALEGAAHIVNEANERDAGNDEVIELA